MMKTTFLRCSLCVAIVLALAALPGRMAAQMSIDKVAAINRTLQQVKATYDKLPPRQQKMLDGNANVVHIAAAWKAHAMRLTDPTFTAQAKQVRAAEADFRRRWFAPGIVGVSNSATDLAYSSFAGFTQSETSTARCGNSVVVGFNDSGSVFETNFLTGVGGQAFSGAAYSTNAGKSFIDIGPINPGSSLGNFLGGDPVVNCSDANTFFFSQIFDYVDSSGASWTAIAVNRSGDGGKIWGEPVAAISKDFTHLLDKPWSTIDPSNPKRMFVSYTDFDLSGTSAACGANVRTAIEFVESDDAGNTWSTAPKVAIEVCGSNGVQGSQMVVDSHGTLYISWVNLGSNFPLSARPIQISSLKGGVLSAAVTAEPGIQPGGDSYFLEGEFRDFLSMSMAVDRSGTATDGTLFITWADGRDKCVPDLLGTSGEYCYDDVFARQSSDGGNTWGFAPTKVNSDIQARLGSGHDHYQPGVAVDSRGYLAVCWYDRRDDPRNFAIARYCAESANGLSGLTSTNTNLGILRFAPTRGNDLLVNSSYMGDYDQLSSDFLNLSSGFVGAFQTLTDRGDPDVVAHSMN
jgi:hypothetical protein